MTNKREVLLMAELAYIAGISTGQVKRVATRAMAKYDAMPDDAQQVADTCSPSGDCIGVMGGCYQDTYGHAPSTMTCAKRAQQVAPAVLMNQLVNDKIELQRQLDAARAQQVAVPQGWTSELPHLANEWADAATNGPQYLKNVRDGICTFDAAISGMERDIAHCREVRRAMLAAAPQSPHPSAIDAELRAAINNFRASQESAPMPTSEQVEEMVFGQQVAVQREPMTETELFDALFAIEPETQRLPPGFIEFARAVEAYHGIKEQP